MKPMKQLPISLLDTWFDHARAKALRWIAGKGTPDGRDAYAQGFEEGWHYALTILSNTGYIRVDESK